VPGGITTTSRSEHDERVAGLQPSTRDAQEAQIVNGAYVLPTGTRRPSARGTPENHGASVRVRSDARAVSAQLVRGTPDLSGIRAALIERERADTEISGYGGFDGLIAAKGPSGGRNVAAPLICREVRRELIQRGDLRHQSDTPDGLATPDDGTEWTRRRRERPWLWPQRTHRGWSDRRRRRGVLSRIDRADHEPTLSGEVVAFPGSVGVATSAYQIEGSVAGGSYPSIWDNLRRERRIQDHSPARWVRPLRGWKTDLDLMKELGVTSLSVLSRVAADPATRAPKTERRRARFYNQPRRRLLSRGIAPVATLTTGPPQYSRTRGVGVPRQCGLVRRLRGCCLRCL